MSRSLSSRLAPFKPIAWIVLFYLVISEIAQTLLFTIVTYLVTAAGKSGVEFGNTVNEIADQYRLLAYAIATTLVSVTLWLGDKALYRHVPFWNELHRPAWQLDRPTKEELLRGASSGGIAALVFLAVFTFSGQVSYLGMVITSSLGTPVFPLFFLDLFCLSVLVVCDEFLFRHKILRALYSDRHPHIAVFVTSILYVLGKYVQFPLMPLDYLNLFCLNLAMGYFYLKSGKAHRGLAFLLSLFVVLHPFAGLPLWGQESPSFFLFKETSRATALLSGGSSGPLAGLGLFSILVVFTIGGHYSWKRGAKMPALHGNQVR